MSTKQRVLIGIVEAAVVALAAIGAYYLWSLRHASAPPAALAPLLSPQTPAAPSVTGAVPAPAPTHFLVPEPPDGVATDASPPPSLDESDAAFEKQLAGLLGQANVEQLFHATDIIRRIVSTTVNAGGKALPSELSPLNPLGSPFQPGQGAQGPVLDEGGFARYSPYVKALSALNVTRTAAIYIRFYPLFQAAYADLGTPGYFNDRLVEAIDSALAAPETKPPIALVQPNLVYKFADPKLEALSAVQKILVRMGPENAAVVKDKLRQFRELIAHPPK